MSLKIGVAFSAMLAALGVVVVATEARSVTATFDIECPAFHKNPNGSWTLEHETTVSHGIFGVIVEPGQYRRHDKDVFGEDLAHVLDEHCANAASKK